MKIFIFTTLLILLSSVETCSDRQLTESRKAEAHYVDLLYAIHQENKVSALAAETKLREKIDLLNLDWRRPQSERKRLACRKHLDEARGVYLEVRQSLREGDYYAAQVQLDRAMCELDAADHQTFVKLYIGRLYDFYSSWREVHTIVNDQMLCLMEWTEYTWWTNLASADWLDVKDAYPDESIYNWDQFTATEFAAAKQKLTKSLEEFSCNVGRGDQCASQELAAAVEAALWELLLLFGHASLGNL